MLLLIVAIVIYWQGLQEDKIVEFTVFNSQYVGRESQHADSERDFPNFDVRPIGQPEDDEGKNEERSSERRRRRRKADKLQNGQ